MILKIHNLEARYGAIHALKGVSLEVGEGEIVTLIGSNGAGKTTLLKAISGLLKPSAGSIEYRPSDDRTLSLEGMEPHRIVAAGVAQAPEGRQIFANLSVKENLELGAYSRRDGKNLPEFEEVFALFPRLKERLAQNAGTLSGGEQQMLAIGRALMAKPRLLLLDEPSLGIAPALVQQIFATLKRINARGVSILLVEQDAFLALETAHRGYVLETGCVVLSGPAAKLLSDPEVKRAYLGQ